MFSVKGLSTMSAPKRPKNGPDPDVAIVLLGRQGPS